LEIFRRLINFDCHVHCQLPDVQLLMRLVHFLFPPLFYFLSLRAHVIRFTPHLLRFTLIHILITPTPAALVEEGIQPTRSLAPIIPGKQKARRGFAATNGPD